MKIIKIVPLLVMIFDIKDHCYRAALSGASQGLWSDSEIHAFGILLWMVSS